MRPPSDANFAGLTLAVLLCALLLAACGASPATTPAPVPATAVPPTLAPRPVVPTATGLPTPDKAPAAASGNAVAGLKTKGVLRVATTLDNPPFSTVNDQLQPDGLDIALITDLAKRLGLQADINDFTFDHLGGALVNDEADAAIAAISITPERAAQVDFTNVYYAGQDAVLAATDSDITKVASLDDLVKYRVGVQKGSVYESWLEENAVKTGKLAADNLVTYPSPDAGVLDVTAAQIDVFLLDRQPARNFATKGQAKLVGEGLYPQVYGIAVRKGSALLPELNRVLAEAQADGTVKRLVEKYLDVSPEEVLPAASIPLASPTP